MPDYAAARLNMVETQVRANDVTDVRIQKAMLEIPREAFVAERLRSIAYMEGCPDLGNGRALLDPRSFAKLAHLAGVRHGDIVLDVGCGTGYSSAVLARCCARVFALEEDRQLAARARQLLSGTDNVEVVEGRLADGLPQHAPYDVIFMNGASEIRPEALLAQLKEGGRLVCFIRNGAGHAHLFVRGEDAVSDRIAFDAEVPLLPGFARAPSFVF